MVSTQNHVLNQPHSVTSSEQKTHSTPSDTEIPVQTPVSSRAGVGFLRQDSFLGRLTNFVRGTISTLLAVDDTYEVKDSRKNQIQSSDSEGELGE